MKGCGKRDVAILTGTFARLRGLKGWPGRSECSYAVLVPCCDVHTFGMAFPIDIAFVDSRGTVVEVHRRVSPARRFRCPAACLTLERKASAQAWFEKGDGVFVSPA